MRVMLTGGTGFIGGHVLRALVDAGHEPRALVRSSDKLDQMRAAQGIDATVDHVVGDMTDPDSVAEAMRGCDACIHTAAFTSLDPEQMHLALEVNAPGAINVLDTAVAVGCDPIVHLSTMSVIFPPTGDVLSGPDPVQGGGNPYNASKAIQPGRGPQRYVAGGTYMDWDEFHAVVSEVTGCDRALFPTPREALEQMVDAEAVEIMLGIVPGDDAGLLADSGLGSWRPVEETLHDTVAWLIAGGLLEADRAPNCA